MAAVTADSQRIAHGLKMDVLESLRSWLENASLPQSGRLPPERELAERFETNRTVLRRALQVLADEGLITRHVGRGTFRTRQPMTAKFSMHNIANHVSPPQAMQARIIVEPEIARLASTHATSAQIDEMKRLSISMKGAKTWDEYEEFDWRFHNLLAESSGNPLLVEIQRLVNSVRRTVVWGHLAKRPVGPPSNYHSFAEHDRIIDAIINRDRRLAAEAMRNHLDTTASSLIDEDR
jgi:DNA-binding FadR family transcriptional regulator